MFHLIIGKIQKDRKSEVGVDSQIRLFGSYLDSRGLGEHWD